MPSPFFNSSGKSHFRPLIGLFGSIPVLIISFTINLTIASTANAQEMLQAGRAAGGRFFYAASKKDDSHKKESSYKLEKFALLGVRLPRPNIVRSQLNTLNISQDEKKRLLQTAQAGRELLQNHLHPKKRIRLLKPTDRKDFAGRRLAIVETKQGKSLNLLLVERGYGYPRWEELKYLAAAERKKFHRALQGALKKREGLWQIWQRRYREEKRIEKIDRQRLPYSQQRRLTLMTYNVENLFDTYDSPKNRDMTFLPLAEKKRRGQKQRQACSSLRGFRRRDCLELDWSKKRLKIKMERLAKVILQAGSGNSNRGPEILFLQEIENYSVLKSFRHQYLKKSGYRIIHFESRDRRGIDVAILTRLLPAALPEYYEIDFSRKKRTRGILHAPLLLADGAILHAFVFHFPSQYSPTPWRQEALRFLSLLKNSVHPGEYLIAGGDCNITRKEEQQLYPRYLPPFWKVSHQEGCKGCRGTSYYPPKKLWSFFDLFYYSLNLQEKKGWYISANSIQIFHPLPFQNNAQNRPQAYREPHFAGVSDHWPLTLELSYKESKDSSK